MEFEWDQVKSETNLRDRGFRFDFAALIFEGPVIERIDARRDYGAVGEAILLVVYTDRDEARRIISARRAGQRERAEWRLFASR